MARTSERMSELELQLRGYRLATLEVVYHLPDHPGILQSFVWQQYDLAPEFPRFRRFVEWWERHLDGRIHSVRIAHAQGVTVPKWRHARWCFELE